MPARILALVACLPALALASQSTAPAAPAWLPARATIEFPANPPITVDLYVDVRTGRPAIAYADYDAAHRAAREGDGDAAYLLYENGLLCDVLKRSEARAEPSPGATSETPERQRLDRFCATMPQSARGADRYWLLEAARAGHVEAAVEWGMMMPRDESRAILEGLWYRGHLLALGELADHERQWTELSPEPARTLLVRSVGYEWLYVRLSEAAYGAASEHRTALDQVARNFNARWDSLNDEEQQAALVHARSLLLESQDCCTVPLSGPRPVF